MNFSLVLNLVGSVLFFSSLFMLAPFITSFYFREANVGALGTTFLLYFFSGLLLYFITKSQKKIELKHRDGFAIVTLSWITMSFFGALPYVLSGVTLSFTKGILLWRSMTQWMGGMGIIVFSLAILPMLGTGGMQLFKAEVPEIGVEKLRPRIIDMSKSLWYIYAGLTAVLAILLSVAGMDLFDSVCHAFTTMATGGFSTKSSSIAYFKSGYIDVIITVFMFLAGINFSLHFYALRGGFSRFMKSSEFKFYCTVVFISIVVITITVKSSGYESLLEAMRYASFQAVSITTTTGYATADYELWPVFPQMILRILLMFKQAYRELYHLIHPRALSALKLDERNIPKETLGGIWGFLFLFILICVIATLLMTALGVDIITSSTTVISAMSNVGPALGDAGPTENYYAMSSAGKWILIMCMLIGRLEIYTVILLFMPMFWRK
jgi:trk system potassium uptake protein TrkH